MNIPVIHRLTFPALLALTLTLTLSSCLDPCGTTLLSEVTSPDGKNKAVVFIFGCGATTSDSICVAIIPATEKQPRTGNVYVGEYLTPLAVRWASDTALVVTGDSDNEVSHKAVVLNRINIVYEAQPSASPTPPPAQAK